MSFVPAQDRFREFREAVELRESALESTTRTSNKRQRVKFGKAKRAASLPPGAPLEDNWSKQAEQVATNLRSFSAFLLSIRRAYLDLGSSSAHHASQPRTLDTTKGLSAWEGVRWLSDCERDEIDFGVKVAIRRSVDRVRELEAAEKQRLANNSRRNPNQGLSRFLGLSNLPTSTTSTILTSHRNCVLVFLNTLLARVSEHQRNQQEARVMRQLERSATLGGLGGGRALGMEEYGKGKAEKARVDHVLKKGSGNAKASTSGPNSAVPSIYRPTPFPSAGSASREDGSLEGMLSAAQIQQFEAEESVLLKSSQSDLASLKLAESSLLEIASLQSQLALHLSQQGELTDKLWEEAVGVTGKVEEGNVQLKKARERNRESRVWILVFLMMASGTLIFLDQY
ncbi:syntaxin 18, partial [Phenoliferia sp. Uapishka_3]